MDGKSNNWCHYKRHSEGGHVKSEAEAGVTLPKAKEHREPPGAGGVNGKFSSGAFRGRTGLQHLDVGLLASGTVRQ